MGVVFWILIILGILFIIFYSSKINKIKEGERKHRDKAECQAKEQIISPQKKLHEEEKKRWEDEYYRRQAKRER